MITTQRPGVRPRHVGCETHCLCEQLTFKMNIVIVRNKQEYICMVLWILAARSQCKGSVSGTLLGIPEIVMTVVFHSGISLNCTR